MDRERALMPNPYPSRRYAWFVVGVLLAMSVVSYVDRQLLAIVVGPMKQDLGLTDAAIGLLFGVFSIFYAVAGLPIAWLADRYSRRCIVFAGVFVWSLMTIGTGLSASFAQVFAARVGVGMGEASLVPSTHSLVGDCFPRERVPMALSVFQTGSVVGSGIAFVVGGFMLQLAETMHFSSLPVLGALHPWQLVFVFIGAPGIPIALLAFTMREPIRRARSSVSNVRESLKDLGKFYRTNCATFILHHLGFLSLGLMGYGFTFWTVSFFTRVHHLPAATAAQIFGWIFLIAGPLGAVWTARIAERRAARGEGDGNIVGAMMGAAISIPVILAIQFAPTATLAFILYAPAMFFVSSPFGLAYGSLPVITPPRIRATVAAVFLFCISIGMMLGPPVTGLFNDHIFPNPDGVRYSQTSVTLIFGGLGLLLLALCRRHYSRSLAAAEAAEAEMEPISL